SPRVAAQAESPPPRTPAPADPRQRRATSGQAPALTPPRRAPEPEDEGGESVSLTVPVRRQSVLDVEASQSVSLTTPMRRISSVDVESADSISLTSPMRRPSLVDAEASQSVSLTTPMRRMSSLEEDAGDSVSLTPPTVNQRHASRPVMPASRVPPPVNVGDDDDHFSTDASLSGAVTHPTPRHRDDDDDDESTAGYAGYEYDTAATPSRGGAKWLLPVLVLFVVALAAVAWWAWNSRGPQPLPSVPDLSAQALKPQPPPARPQQSPTPPPVHADTPVPESAPATSGGADAGSPATGGAGTSPEAQALGADTPHEPVAPPMPPEGPTLVAVRFEAPARTLLKQESGDKLAVNALLNLPAGTLRVSYACPGRRAPKGKKSYLIERASEGPLVLPVPCKARR
ncbi:hypothetical protein LZ198_42625, partial [Myxococcus sp. K15C18031901]|nr:hypothetical protein [Myxococcus dinghuensis]